MYDVLMQEMEAHGLQQYEISNFAQPGFASTHNNIYWENDEYAGFGAGAHGYLGGLRYSNHGPLKKIYGCSRRWRITYCAQTCSNRC